MSFSEEQYYRARKLLKLGHCRIWYIKAHYLTATLCRFPSWETTAVGVASMGKVCQILNHCIR